MRKFLIINPFGIGDVLFTTPVIRALKSQYPDSFIGYWSNLRVEPMLSKYTPVDKVLALSRGDLKKKFRESFFKGWMSLFKLISQIKNEHFDICFDFSLDHRYSLVAKIAGIKQRVGFDYKHRGRFLTERVKLDSYQHQHVIEYYLGLLKFLKIPVKDKHMFLDVPADEGLKAKSILLQAKIKETDLLIGIFAGAGGSWGQDAVIKHWPVENFTQVADKLIDKFGAKVILLGDDSEVKISQTIMRLMRHQAVDLTGKIPLEILPAIIKNCNLLITNDGGPMHIACALGVKSVSVFGPVSEIAYGPYPPDQAHRVLKSDLSCRPCYQNFRLGVCDKDKECLKQVSVEAVFNGAVELLA